jgi:selenide,water dikinase
MKVELTQQVAAAGCAAKLGPGDLAQVLHLLPTFHHPDLLVGTETNDDAGVFRLRPDLAIVNTVDFFTPIVDDPFVFGQVAAANALSDIYAMGAEPKTALNIVGFPKGKMEIEVLVEILKGGADKVREAGAVVVGGHSIIDPEIKYGLAITGVVHPDQIIRNVGARDGDALVLTKPLGTGIITTSVKQRQLAHGPAAAGHYNAQGPAAAFARRASAPKEAGHYVRGRELDERLAGSLRAAVASMTALNADASTIMRRYAVHACSDVTGFGLLGHAQEMASGSGVTLVVDSTALPLLEGAPDLAEAGHLTGGCKRNRAYLHDKVVIEASVRPGLVEVAFDPQTSGGLLIALPRNEAARLVEELHAGGIAAATIIGHVTARQAHAVRLV